MTRILIAEDEARIVSFLEKGLRAGGYTTVAVGTGPDALPSPATTASTCCCSTSACPA